MKIDLSGVPETLLIPLWARAEESTKPDPIFTDAKATDIVSMIDYDFSKFEKAWITQVGVAVRTKLFDDAVYEFQARKPDAAVVNLGAGLDTRRSRIRIGDLTWYDLDVPESLELRQRFFEESDRCKSISKSVFDLSWMDEIEDDGKPVLLIAEGLFMYFPEDELKSLFKAIADRFAGGEMLFEMLAPFLVGKSKRHDSLKSMDGTAEFKWALKDSRDLTGWHSGIEHVGVRNYFDHYKGRWKWFGAVARLPIVRPRLASRIVHLRFKNPPEKAPAA